MSFKKWKNYDGNINILSNIQEPDIAKLISEKEIHSLQFYEFEKPNQQTWSTLNSFFKKHPEVELSIIWQQKQDFSFYKNLPYVRKFSISSFGTKDFSILQSNTELKSFSIGETKSKSVDVSFIKKLSKLEEIYIDGMKKGIENIGHLQKLKTISLRAIKLANLQFLTSVKNLEKLELLYGSYENIEALHTLQNIKRLELSRVRNINDFAFITHLNSLESLTIEGQTRLVELPNYGNLKKLEYLGVQNNRNLTDISNINHLQKLKVFWLSFAENQKVKEIKHLLEQAAHFILHSKSIQYTNIFSFPWLDDATKEKLYTKGIKEYSEWIVLNQRLQKWL